jgi:hypothetical protein
MCFHVWVTDRMTWFLKYGFKRLYMGLQSVLMSRTAKDNGGEVAPATMIKHVQHARLVRVITNYEYVRAKSS